MQRLIFTYFLVGFSRVGDMHRIRLVRERLLSRDVLAAPLTATVDLRMLMIMKINGVL